LKKKKKKKGGGGGSLKGTEKMGSLLREHTKIGSLLRTPPEKGVSPKGTEKWALFKRSIQNKFSPKGTKKKRGFS